MIPVPERSLNGRANATSESPTDRGNTWWEEVNPDQLEAAQYVIAVNEFTEAEIPGLQPLTREEFRKICNAHKTKPEILQALSGPSP